MALFFYIDNTRTKHAHTDSDGYRKRPPYVRAYMPFRFLCTRIYALSFSSKSQLRAPPPDPSLNWDRYLSLPGAYQEPGRRLLVRKLGLVQSLAQRKFLQKSARQNEQRPATSK